MTSHILSQPYFHHSPSTTLCVDTSDHSQPLVNDTWAKRRPPTACARCLWAPPSIAIAEVLRSSRLVLGPHCTGRGQPKPTVLPANSQPLQLRRLSNCESNPTLFRHCSD